MVLNLGTALQELGRLTEAISLYENFLRTNPGSPDILFHLGTAYLEYCKQEEALHAFEEVLRKSPGAFHAALAHCIARVPVIYMDESDVAASRKKYHDELVSLNHTVGHMDTRQIDASAKAVGSMQPFYLASGPQRPGASADLW